MSTALSKDYIKNVDTSKIPRTLGNNGLFFPFLEKQVPNRFLENCSLALEENRQISFITEDGKSLFINCS